MTSEPREGHFRVGFAGKRKSVVVRGRFHLIGACRKCLPVGLKVEGNIDRHPIKRKSSSRARGHGCKNKHTNYRSHSFLLFHKTPRISLYSDFRRKNSTSY